MRLPARTCKLTIDNDLQRAAELALGDRNGAIVAMDPRNGEILAMVSRPSFDPNAFAVRIDRIRVEQAHHRSRSSADEQGHPGAARSWVDLQDPDVGGWTAGRRRAGHARECAMAAADFYGYFYHCDEQHGAVDIHNAIPYLVRHVLLHARRQARHRPYREVRDRIRLRAEDRHRPAGRAGGPDAVPAVDDEELSTANGTGGDASTLAIGQGAVEATPIQLARIIGGIASDGHLVRPHTVFPDELPADFHKALLDTYPGSGDEYVPINPATWETITDGMAQTTQPGLYHTAGAEGLAGIDFAGKTGTAQVVGHDTKVAKSHLTLPNVWFVGVVPRRNPELVVAVLFQNGDKSWFAARIGARVVSAYVEKQRRLANNLQPTKAPAAPKPVEVGAVWTAPDQNAKSPADRQTAKLHAGRFFINPDTGAHDTAHGALLRPSQLGIMLPARRIENP